MLLAIANAGREEKIKLIGPKGLKFVVEGLLRIAQDLSFEIEYIEQKKKTNINVIGLDIDFVPAVHSVKCLSYSFSLRRKGKFDAEKAKALNIPKK